MRSEASEAIVRGLKAAGVDLVAMLPDHGFDRVQKSIAADDKIYVRSGKQRRYRGGDMCGCVFRWKDSGVDDSDFRFSGRDLAFGQSAPTMEYPAPVDDPLSWRGG